ncbi:MAG: preprotein translocase subunit SecY, partial [Pirellulaceae bacterium]
MWEKLRIVFAIPELRQKILLTLGFLAIYRVGWQIALPVIDQDVLNQTQSSGAGFGDFVDKVAVFAASDLRQATIFGLGIMPYISASIIFQLLGSVWKPIEDLRKEGETGRKKINEYTRYLTVLLCFIQSWFYVQWYLMNADASNGLSLIDAAFRSDPADPWSLSFGWQITTVMTMTCGTIFLMWLGEQIDEFGIGNGISLLIMAGILARMPAALFQLRDNFTLELRGLGGAEKGVETLVVLAALFVSIVFGVVFITLGQRRIPTQSAKHVRGRRVYGGTRQYLPLRINQAGVMPIIFASSLLMIPAMLFNLIGRFEVGWDWKIFTTLGQWFGNSTSFLHNLCYVALIYFFCYFWTAIT